MPMDQVGRMVNQALTSNGFKAGEAAMASRELIAEGTHSLRGRMVRDMISGRGAEAARSEVFDANELTARIQGGVTGESNKQSELLRQLVEQGRQLLERQDRLLSVRIED
jgi:hypothetical protein